MPDKLQNEVLIYWRASRAFRSALSGAADSAAEIADALDEIEVIVKHTEWDRLRQIASKAVQTIGSVTPLAKVSRGS